MQYHPLPHTKTVFGKITFSNFTPYPNLCKSSSGSSSSSGGGSSSRSIVTCLSLLHLGTQPKTTMRTDREPTIFEDFPGLPKTPNDIIRMRAYLSTVQETSKSVMRISCTQNPFKVMSISCSTTRRILVQVFHTF